MLTKSFLQAGTPISVGSDDIKDMSWQAMTSKALALQAGGPLATEVIRDNELQGSQFVDQAVPAATCTEQASSFMACIAWQSAIAPWSECSAPLAGCMQVGLWAALQSDGVSSLTAQTGPHRTKSLRDALAWQSGQHGLAASDLSTQSLHGSNAGH